MIDAVHSHAAAPHSHSDAVRHLYQTYETSRVLVENYTRTFLFGTPTPAASLSAVGDCENATASLQRALEAATEELEAQLPASLRSQPKRHAPSSKDTSQVRGESMASVDAASGCNSTISLEATVELKFLQRDVNGLIRDALILRPALSALGCRSPPSHITPSAEMNAIPEVRLARVVFLLRNPPLAQLDEEFGIGALFLWSPWTGGVLPTMHGQHSEDSLRVAIRFAKNTYQAEALLSKFLELYLRHPPGDATERSRWFVRCKLSELNPHHGAKNELSLCLLHAAVGHRVQSLKRGHKAVQLFTTLCMHNASRPSSDQQIFGSSFMLLPAALFHLADVVLHVGGEVHTDRERKASASLPEIECPMQLLQRAFVLASQFLPDCGDSTGETAVRRIQAQLTQCAKLEDPSLLVKGEDDAVEQQAGCLLSGESPRAASLTPDIRSNHSSSRPGRLSSNALPKKPPHHLYRELPPSLAHMGSAPVVQTFPLPFPYGEGHAIQSRERSLHRPTSPEKRLYHGGAPQPLTGAPIEVPRFALPSTLPSVARVLQSLDVGRKRHTQQQRLGTLTAPSFVRAQSPLSVHSRANNRAAVLRQRQRQQLLRTWPKSPRTPCGGTSSSMALSHLTPAASSGLRLIHRLRRPEDAFELNGLVRDASLSVDNLSAAEKQQQQQEARAMHEIAVRKYDRSFLPEDIQAKEDAAIAKEERRLKRERHEAKKAEHQRRLSIRQEARARQGAAQQSKYDSLGDGTHDDGSPQATATGGHVRGRKAGGRGSYPVSAGQVAAPHRSVDSEGTGASGSQPGRSGTRVARHASSHTLSGNGSPRSKLTGRKNEGGEAATRRPPSRGAVPKHDPRGGGRIRPRKPQRTGSTAHPEDDDHAGVLCEEGHEDVAASSDLSSLSESIPPLTPSTEDTELPVETTAEKKSRIEREVVSLFTLLHDRRERAVCVLQRAWRCSRSRLDLHNRRQVLYRFVYVRQKAAAMCIVGYLRTIILRGKREIILQQRAAEDTARANEERRMVAAAQCITRAMVRWYALRKKREDLCKLLNIRRDERLRCYEAAATIVQRWWRIAPATRDYWRRRRVEVAEQMRLQAEAQRVEGAVTCIQRHVRGMWGRREFSRARVKRAYEIADRRRRVAQSADLLITVLREYDMRRQRLARQAQLVAMQADEAAKVVQSGWRAALQRRRLQQTVDCARLLRRSATCIQRIWRRYYAGRELRFLRRVHDTVQQDRIDAEFQLFRATVCVQGFGRLVLAKQEFRRRKALAGRVAFEAMWRLQAAGQGYLGRKHLAQYQAEVVAQARQAAHDSALRRLHSIEVVRGFLLAKGSVEDAARRRTAKYFDTELLRRQVRAELHNEACATCIQRCVRRWLRRRRDQEAAAEAAAVRAFITEMVIRVQCWWRQCMARANVQHRRALHVHLTRKRLDWEEVDALLREEKLDALHLYHYHERIPCPRSKVRAALHLDEGEDAFPMNVANTSFTRRQLLEKDADGPFADTYDIEE